MLRPCAAQRRSLADACLSLYMLGSLRAERNGSSPTLRKKGLLTNSYALGTRGCQGPCPRTPHADTVCGVCGVLATLTLPEALALFIEIVSVVPDACESWSTPILLMKLWRPARS